MERPVFQPVGTLVEDLDTPALVVDLEVMDRNIEVLHAYFRESDANLRPHVAGHQCSQIAHQQLAAGGTVVGIGVTTVGEAEVFSSAGFDDILVANQVVTKAKIGRLCALADRVRIAVAVDNSQNVDDLSSAAVSSGVTIDVLVEVEAGMGRCGVPAGNAALELAKHAAKSPGLNFAGLMAITPLPFPANQEGGALSYPDRTELESTARRQIQPVLDTRELIEQDGVPVPMVSIGGTHNYEVAAQMPGVTEVQAGAYALMDYNRRQTRPEFNQAAKILAQVISHPVEGRAVLDAGHKATGPDLGVPVLEGFPGGRATRFSAEHGILELEDSARQQLNPGDKAWLLPFNLELCLNQYDFIRAVRGGKLVGFWPMAARGHFG